MVDYLADISDQTSYHHCDNRSLNERSCLCQHQEAEVTPHGDFSRCQQRCDHLQILFRGIKILVLVIFIIDRTSLSSDYTVPYHWDTSGRSVVYSTARAPTQCLCLSSAPLYRTSRSVRRPSALCPDGTARSDPHRGLP